MERYQETQRPPSVRESLALAGLHTVEALGGAALIWYGIKISPQHGDLSGALGIPGSFVVAHGAVEGANNFYKSARDTLKARSASESSN